MELAQLTTSLERVYGRILAERMQGLPVINPALSVQAVGFGPWHGDALGVMLTPWFMNLMLLPHLDPWPPLPPGQQVRRRFPSGDYRFTTGHEPGIGTYLMCSLFSPVFQLPDQVTAIAVAQQSLVELLREPTAPGISRRQLLRGRFPRHGDDPA